MEYNKGEGGYDSELVDRVILVHTINVPFSSSRHCSHFLLVRIGKELYFCLHNLVQNCMTCVTEVAQGKKGMQESGSGGGHDHRREGGVTGSLFTSDGGANV